MSKTTRTETVESEVRTERFDQALVGKLIRDGACECSRYTMESDESTDCSWFVPRIFKQGHDATLKSLLIRASAVSDTIIREDKIANGRILVRTQQVMIIKAKGDETHVTHVERVLESPLFDRVYTQEPILTAAGRYGFADQVRRGAAAIANKSAAKIRRKAAKQERAQAAKVTAVATKARTEAKAGKVNGAEVPESPATLATEVKVGRWWYPIVEGVVGASTGALCYTDKKGERQWAKAGAEVR